jgi:cation:H+ antiporter
MNPESGKSVAGLAPWQVRVALAAACTVPGLLTRLGGGAVPYPMQIVAYGSAVAAAAFMLAWACEAAQVDIASGFVVAIVAFVAILPEYIVEVHYALIGSAEYTTANLTGASRLLLGFCVGMPAVVALLPRRWRPARIGPLELDAAHRLELGILALAALWGLSCVFRGHLSLLDAAVLIALYGWYLLRVFKMDGDSPELEGVPAQLAALPQLERRRWLRRIMAYAAFVILLTAVPLGDAVLGTGQLVGISPYLMLQWVVPVVTEMPELVVAFVLLVHGRGGQSILVLLAGVISQYTLALGTLPLAYDLGRGVGPLPMAGQERIELFLTVAVALFTVAAFIRLRLSRGDATIMLTLFVAQFVLPTVFTRLVIGIVFGVVAIDILVAERPRLRPLFAALLPASSRGASEAPAPMGARAGPGAGQ